MLRLEPNYLIMFLNKRTQLKGLPKINETHALLKPVTSNSVPTPQESKVVENDNMIALGMFRINPFKPSREENYVPNKVRASVRTNSITVSQPHVITKKDVNYDSNGLSFTGVDNTAKTRRPLPRSNTKNDMAPSASKSSCSKNKEVEVEEHPRNLLLSKNKKHMSSECNKVKLAIRNDKYEVIYAMCKQCLITANHDVCVINYVNDMNSRGKKQKANVLNIKNQKKENPKVMKHKKIGSNERLASPKPSKPRSCLRWSPTERLFDLKGKIITTSEYESQSDCSNVDNACTSNPSGPTIKRLPNSTSFLGKLSKFVYAGSDSRPPMLNKENYVPWSSRLLRCAKSRPNGNLIHNSILNGPYVRKMIPEPGDANRDLTVTKTFHLQTDDELSDKELKQIEADDQAIQTILLGLPEDIYAAVDSCETAQEI
nr:hypothetical protein [Tanacetum cinerariifolium]